MFLGEKTHLDNLKSNTTHWQINKYWPKALLVTSVQHERLLRFHTAKSSGRCPQNDLHWLVIFFPLSFSSLLLLLWLPSVQVSNKLRQWELRWRERPSQSGTVWDDRNIHQSILWFDKRRRWQKVGCLQRVDVIHRQKHQQHDETFTDSNISSTSNVPILLLLLLSSRALSPDTEAAHNSPLLERLNRN